MAACGVSKCGLVFPGAAVDGCAADVGVAAGDVGVTAGAAACVLVAAACCCTAAVGRDVAATFADSGWLAQPVARAATNAAAASMARRRRTGLCRPGCGAAWSPASRPGTACAFSPCG